MGIINVLDCGALTRLQQSRTESAPTRPKLVQNGVQQRHHNNTL